jgi:hypothetical protein
VKYSEILVAVDKGLQVIFYIKAPRIIELKDCSIYKLEFNILDKKSGT